MTIRATIDKAGAFPVTQIPCHHFSDTIKTDAPRAAVLHTTEGYWDGALNEFRVKFAPHFLLGMSPRKKVEIAQLVPIGFIGAALEHHNDLAIVQIEMIGFSKETPWLPDGQTVDALASLMNVIHDEWGVVLSRPWKDGDYGRAGYHTPHRASGYFGKIPGWFAHADIPENQHWDVGNMTWGSVFAHAKALQAVPPAPPIRGIAWAQSAINRTGYRPTLMVDGVRGPETAFAIRAFQQSKNLPATGLLDPDTITALAAISP